MILEYASDQQMLRLDCAYAGRPEAPLVAHTAQLEIPRRSSYVNTHVLFISASHEENTMNMNTNTVLTKKIWTIN